MLYENIQLVQFLGDVGAKVTNLQLFGFTFMVLGMIGLVLCGFEFFDNLKKTYDVFCPDCEVNSNTKTWHGPLVPIDFVRVNEDMTEQAIADQFVQRVCWPTGFDDAAYTVLGTNVWISVHQMICQDDPPIRY